MMYLTMGKRMKIRYNVIFAIRNVTKEEIALALRLGWKRKVKLKVFYESYLVDIPPNFWWIDTGASIHIMNSLQGYLTSKRLSKGERTITLGNGTEVEIKAIGTLFYFGYWFHYGFSRYSLCSCFY